MWRELEGGRKREGRERREKRWKKGEGGRVGEEGRERREREVPCRMQLTNKSSMSSKRKLMISMKFVNISTIALNADMHVAVNHGFS